MVSGVNCKFSAYLDPQIYCFLLQNKNLVERHAGSGITTLPIVSERFVSTQGEISSSESEADGQSEDVVSAGKATSFHFDGLDI